MVISNGGEEMDTNNKKVYELRVKVYILKDIPLREILAKEAEYIDSALAKNERWLEYHETNRFKNYCFGGLYPIEKEGVYKKDNIYTVTVRTVDSNLAQYFSKVLRNHYTDSMKGLTVENRVLPRKVIGEIYSLTPVIQKSDGGYWKNQMSLEEFERRLFDNAVKKYNQYTGKKIDEDFQLYTNITFLNRKPIANQYKGIQLLGDKVNLKIADNAQAQELAYFLLGTGLCELNSRGYGYCNYRWL